MHPTYRVLPEEAALDPFPGSARDLDILTAVERIEQLGREIEEYGDPSARLVDRLVTCDAPRLRALLPAPVVEWARRAGS